MKKILALVLSLVLSFSLVACGGGNSTEEAKKVTESFIELVKKLETKKANELVVENKKSENLEDIDTNTLSEQEKITLQILSKAKYKFVEGEVKDGEENTTLKYEVEGPTIASIQTYIMKEGNTEALKDMDAFLKNFDLSKVESEKRNLEVKLQKESDGWKISNPDEVLALLVGAN